MIETDKLESQEDMDLLSIKINPMLLKLNKHSVGLKL